MMDLSFIFYPFELFIKFLTGILGIFASILGFVFGFTIKKIILGIAAIFRFIKSKLLKQHQVEQTLSQG